MTDSELITKLERNKDQAFKWQERRHSQWTESYEMYRDRVQVNRLIQRQSVNLPLMKMTLRTLMSKFKRFVAQSLVFEDYGNDKQKDIFKNAFWEYCFGNSKLKAKDRANKKQVMLYGRTFWKMLVSGGKFVAEVVDPQDVLVDRFADPSDIDGTAQFQIHLHIYRTLKELENTPGYDEKAISNLKVLYSTVGGMKKAAENAQSAADKAQRMSDLGVPDVLDPQVGETIIEINEHYVRLWDHTAKKFRYHLVTKVDDQILRNNPLSEILDPENRTNGYWNDHTPLFSWGDDEERTDVWSDGVADIIRTINKVLNAWFSQLIENRTLRNFGMNYYDATANETWAPQTFDPRPFGWYPLPGKPADVFQKVDIPDLSESIDEMQFLITMGEQATAATATQKGTSEKSQITLGEVKMMLVEAEDRINDMQEPYEDSWIAFGEKWSKLITGQADNLDAIPLYKKGFKGNYFPADVTPADWLSRKGYNCVVKSAADKEKDQINGIQKLMAVKQQFPQNAAFKRIVDKQLLELAGLNPEEVKEVESEEEQIQKSNAVMAKLTAAFGAGAPPGQPTPLPSRRTSDVRQSAPAPVPVPQLQLTA